MSETQDFENQIREEFINEAKELLEETESLFLELEQNSEDVSLIDNIFRLAHTVKGSGYAAGFTDLAEFAHVFETLLGDVRGGKISLNTDIVDVLLQSNDTLIRYIDALSEDMDSIIETEDVANRIRSFLDQKSIEAVEKTASDSKDGTSNDDSGGGLHLFDDEPEEETSSNITTASETESKETESKEIEQVSIEVISSDVKPTISEVKESEKKCPSGHILVVDDEPDIRDLLEAFLEEMGLPILTAEDGNQALEVLKNNTVDLIFTDVKMPNMTGIEFIEEVRKFDANIPVVFVSGAAEKEDIIRFIEFGAFAFIQKPFDQDRLLIDARNALKMKYTKDSVVKLSGLNYKAYMAMMKLSRNKDSNKAKELSKQLEVLLDDIAKNTNELLKLNSSSAFSNQKIG